MTEPHAQLSAASEGVKCMVCSGEKRVSYVQSAGGFSEPADCYACNGTGMRPVKTRCPTCGKLFKCVEAHHLIKHNRFLGE